MFGLLVTAASVTLTKISGFGKDDLTTRPMPGPNRSEHCQTLPGGISVPGHTDTSPYSTDWALVLVSGHSPGI